MIEGREQKNVYAEKMLSEGMQVETKSEAVLYPIRT
jgi:hypothetical protein